jgi:hypothetical protein
VVNGSVTKPATDDPGMLAQRLSIVEARLGVVEAALQLEPDAEDLLVRSPRYLGWLTAIAALIAVLGMYWFALQANPELGRLHAAAIATALCYVHHGLPVQRPCVW